MKSRNRFAAMLISLMMIISMMPAMAFADDAADAEPVAPEEAVHEIGQADDADVIVVSDPETAEDEAVVEDAYIDEDEELAGEEEWDESEEGEAEASFGMGLDADKYDGTDPEEQMEEFFFSEDDSAEQLKLLRPLSVKGDRLTGNDLKYYNYYKKIINEVYNGTRKNAYIKVKASTFFGKSTFTASQLGVSKIGYKKNGKLLMTAAAKKKIYSLFNPGYWGKVCMSVLSDLSSKGYWVDWYSGDDLFTWNYYCTYTPTKLTFRSDSYIIFRLSVMPEFAMDYDASNVYAFVADQNKLAAAQTAKDNAQYIVDSFDKELDTTFKNSTDEEIDLNRLWRYCLWTAYLTSYDHEAAEDESIARTSPWSLISVLDGNDDTKAVCAGYARAFKYLCDLSTFKSDWIDCQIVSGDAGGSHMWNIVRMNDGENYLVDPTWMDNDDEDNTIDETWFLRGDPNGTATNFTIYDSDGIGYKRTYEDWIVKAFAPAERKLSTKSTYEYGWDKLITLKKPVIKAPVGGKKQITVKWNKVTAPLGALYVDGYQIRYSTKSGMGSAKKVTVKGYNKASRVIKSLKAKKYYYVQVRTYAKMGGKTYYSTWSAKKKVKTK